MCLGCKFYQLVAYGRMFYFRQTNKIHSKTIFRTKEEAEAAIESFKITCTTPIDELDTTYLDPNREILVKIVELEVSGSCCR